MAAEERNIWLVTDSDAPVSAAYGLVKNTGDVVNDDLPSRFAVKTQAERNSWAAAFYNTPGAGIDAVVTSWRKLPPLLMEDVLAAAAAGSISGTTVTFAGCEWETDDAGRGDPAGGERLAPDTTINTDADLLAAIEAYGSNSEFVEKTTLDKFRVYADTRPGTPDEADLDYVIHRVTGTPTRTAV